MSLVNSYYEDKKDELKPVSVSAETIAALQKPIAANTASGTSTPVSYTDAAGQKHTGYLIGGKTYKDSAGTQRVDNGSIVHTAGGDFIKTSQEGVRTPGGIIDEYKKATSGYQDALKGAQLARENSIKRNVDAAIKRLSAEGDTLQERYNDANKNAYIAYKEATRPFGGNAEELARLGLSKSGVSESSQISLANSYQNQMGENRRELERGLRELALRKEEAVANGDAELAAAIDAYAQLGIQYGFQQAGNILTSEMSIAQNALASDEQRRQYDTSTLLSALQIGDNIKRADRETALSLIQMGIVSQEIADAAGIPLAAAQAYINKNGIRRVDASGGGGPSDVGGYVQGNPPSGEITIEDWLRGFAKGPESAESVYNRMFGGRNAIDAAFGHLRQA